MEVLSREESKLLSEHVVLGMFDRDFSKQFDSDLFERVNSIYFKKYGKNLANY